MSSVHSWHLKGRNSSALSQGCLVAWCFSITWPMSSAVVATFLKMGKQSHELRSQDGKLLDSPVLCAEQSRWHSKERVHRLANARCKSQFFVLTVGQATGVTVIITQITSQRCVCSKELVKYSSWKYKGSSWRAISTSSERRCGP